MNLFLDANIYLGFYELSNDDLEELRKLVVAVREKATKLLLPDQVRDEFYRNREAIIAKSINYLDRAKVDGGVPRLFQSLDEYEAMRDALATYDAQRAALLTTARTLADDRQLHADQLIDALFGTVETLPRTEEVMSAARLRSEIGNPPGKAGSLGDAINWETLLTSVPDGEDLLLVSADGDFSSALHRAKLDPFLNAEWAQKKGSRISLYPSLTALFRENYPDIKLATELEKELAVARLVGSTSFQETHAAISTLSAFTEFSPGQAGALVEAANNNGQIWRILGDTDVLDFYTDLIRRNSERVDSSELETLRENLGLTIAIGTAADAGS